MRERDREGKGEGALIKKRIVVIGCAAACAAAMPVLPPRGF